MSLLFDTIFDDELARLVIAVIASMEMQGARLPHGWRNQPMSLSYLDALHELASDQVRAMPPHFARSRSSLPAHLHTAGT